MARTKTKAFNYFEGFIDLIGKGKEAAILLGEALCDYESIPGHAIAIDTLESEADELVNQIIEEVNNSFITPIDREDIIGITEALDNIIDGIEDIAHALDMYSIEEIRHGAITFSEYVNEALVALYDLMVAFEHFKNFKELNKSVKELGKIEEHGDMLYHETIKALFKEEETPPLEIMKWETLYTYFEQVLNDSERAAKLVRGVAIKNT